MRPIAHDCSYALPTASALRHCRLELRFWSLQLVNVGYQAAGNEVEYWIGRIKTLEAEAEADANKMEDTK